MNFKKTILITTVLWLALFLLVPKASAQGWLTESFNQLGHAGGTTGAGFSEPKDPRLIASQMIRLLLSLVGTVLFVLIAFAGFKWMTAQGNDEQIASSKKTIANSTIGLLIIISAYGITILITNLALGRNLGTNAGSGGQTLDDVVNRALNK
ncbi:MAG: hypothetical protein WC725_03055 [Patescibacteria group bacterium]|jgi:hypothetical protein